MELGESAFIAMQGKNKNQAKQKEKGKVPPQVEIKKKSKYFFCKKKEPMKENCVKFYKWLERKGNPISFVCYESNIVHVNHNT